MSLSPGDPPLKGIRVLDLSRVLAGPFCSMTLSDLGAEVIKVEMPGRGDDTRAFPPFLNGESSYFMSVNRGKKSITMNMKNEKAVEAIHRIAANCDVVLENFRPGVTSRLGVDYEALRKINDDIIYCSISSFGQTGPYAKWPGYDLIIQGMGGLMGITGEPDGPPVRIGVAVTDLNAGMYAVIAILSALRVRDMTGKGQYIDIGMMDTGVSWLTYVAGNYFASGKVPPRMGNAHPSIVPYQGYEAGDGKYILIACGNDRLFKLMCEIMKLDHLVTDPKYSTNDDRVQNREVLNALLGEEFMKQPRDMWLNKLREQGFPCAPVYAVDEIFIDPQIHHREMLVEMDHPKAGKIKQIGAPLKFSESQCKLTTPPPVLGEHTVEVLRDIAGYSEKEINKLKKTGAI
ncbi:MAG: CoA transferase [Candidatus Bathyarchaeota archaeon]|nr:CoA transferase [Candidatus Bathyarchaeota archaeon]